VRGVSVRTEDRLRRWAKVWLEDAASAAESLLVRNARGRAETGVPLKTGGGGRAGATTRDELDRDRRAAVDESSSENDENDENDESSSENDAISGFREGFGSRDGVRDPSRIHQGLPRFVPSGLGSGRDAADPFRTAGKRTVSVAELGLERAFSSPAFSSPASARTAFQGGAPPSLGGTSPATSRRERRRARALGVQPGTPVTATPRRGSRETAAAAVSANASNPFARRGAAAEAGRSIPERSPSRGGGLERERLREGDAFATSSAARLPYDPYSEDDDDDAPGLTSSASRARRRGDRSPNLPEPPESSRGAPLTPAAESSAEDLVRGLGEMNAFDVDFVSEDATASPGERRRMRDADYREASMRAKEITAARRAERSLASPSPATRRPATAEASSRRRAGPSAE
jgi:hypothetical protein